MQRQNHSAAYLTKKLVTVHDKADRALDDLRRERKTVSRTLTRIRQATGWKVRSLDELLVKVSRMNTEEISAPKLKAELDGKKAFFEQVRYLTSGQQRSYSDILAYILQLHSRLNRELPTDSVEATEGLRKLLLDIKQKVDHIDDFCVASAGMHPSFLVDDENNEQESSNNG